MKRDISCLFKESFNSYRLIKQGLLGLRAPGNAGRSEASGRGSGHSLVASAPKGRQREHSSRHVAQSLGARSAACK